MLVTPCIVGKVGTPVEVNSVAYGFLLFNGPYSVETPALYSADVGVTELMIPHSSAIALLETAGFQSITCDWLVFATDGQDTTMSDEIRSLFIDARPLLSVDESEKVFVNSLRKMFPKLQRIQGRDSMFKQSEGNPLFIREIAEELMEVFKSDAKKIILDKTETVLTYNLKASDLGLPPNLELKLGIQIDHQHLAAQLILKLIAVAGRSMTLKEIYHSFPMKHHLDQIPVEIEHLLEEELIYDVNAVKLRARKQSLSKGLDSPLLSMKFYFTTEFLHHAIERRLLLAQTQQLKACVEKMSKMKDLSVPDHIFDDHSVSTEWGLGWGAEELWRLQTAKRERKASEDRKSRS